MTTFIHTADWQLGKPFAGIQDPQKRGLVQQERLEAIRRMGEIVQRTGARFVVVAGDLFDSPTPTKATVASAFEAIDSLGVPVFAIPGNHDHGGPDSLWEQEFFLREHRRLADRFQILLSREPVELDDVVLLPCPLLRRQDAEDPTAWIRSLDMGRFGKRARIVLAHGSTQNFAGEADDEEQAGQPNFIDLARLPATEIDYVALGDWHGFVQVGERAWFSGSHEIDRFPRSGQQPGHVACVTVARGAAPRVEPVKTGRLQWLVHEAVLDDEGPGMLDAYLAQGTSGAGASRCLMKLSLGGSLSLAARKQLDEILESWEARLVRLRLEDGVQLAPSVAEIENMVNRPGDPLISRVAAELVGRLEVGGDQADTVRKALHILHSLCSGGVS